MEKATFFDERERMPQADREARLFVMLPKTIAAAKRAERYAGLLAGIDPFSVTDREALANLPVLRKSSLPEWQKESPPFAGLVADPLREFSRLYSSPGPIFEAEEAITDPWKMARALYAAGIRVGDVVLNTFSYHLTPGGFIFDSAARALQCPVIPAGPGNTAQQLELIAAFRPSVYLGVPDFLKTLLEAWRGGSSDTFPIMKAAVSGAAFPPSLQQELSSAGIEAYQTYATADLGCIAFETPAREGLVINEDIIVEIVRPGTGIPVDDGEVGEVVVTNLSLRRPLIRFALGDLSAILSGFSPCGRTSRRLRGWLGRADQATKVKGMFVRPEQIAEIAKRHRELGRLRLVISRANETDSMVLHAEAAAADIAKAVEETMLVVTKLRGKVIIAEPGTLPNDGKVIVDERG